MRFCIKTDHWSSRKAVKLFCFDIIVLSTEKVVPLKRFGLEKYVKIWKNVWKTHGKYAIVLVFSMYISCDFMYLKTIFVGE